MPEPRRVVPDGGVRAGLNTSGATISAYRIVRRHTLIDSVRPCTAATQRPKGVTMQAIEADVTGDIQIAGKAPIEAGAAFAAEAQLTSDAVGRAIATTTPGDFVIGIAEEAAAGVGSIVEVELA